MELTNKVALVTGSARRVGKVIALELARQGMDLVITHGHSPDDAERTVQAVAALGVRAINVQADLTQEAEINHLFDEIRNAYGRIDLVVNSASAFVRHDIFEATSDSWDFVLNVNLKAPFLITQQAARMMIEQGEGGAIINITDTSGVRPALAYPEHSISKAGLISLTELTAKRFAPFGIRINAIMPGPIMKSDDLDDATWEEIGQRVPAQKTGSAQDVADAVVALATIDYIIGTTLRVDGGETLVGSSWDSPS